MPQIHPTAIVELWVPVVVFAHVFAAFWFLRLYLLHDPRALRIFSRRRRSSNEKLPKARNSEDDECREVAMDDIVLSMEKASQRQGLSHSGHGMMKETRIGKI
jgi:hypothetical protein